jgi:SAM-dependent methyltransferase
MRQLSSVVDRLRSLPRAFRRTAFDNRRFWNQRYIENPEKGSGPGSRGEILLLKSKLIQSVIAENDIETVLDIGCGDIAPLREIELGHYLGVDISDVIVEKNRRLKPQWQFVCADLTGDHCPPSADLVLCLDVLIHQKKKQSYLAILSKTLSCTKKVALISGYSKGDPGWNVFFHEPIIASIKRLSPQARIMSMGAYRGTDLIKVEK